MYGKMYLWLSYVLFCVCGVIFKLFFADFKGQHLSDLYSYENGNLENQIALNM